MLGRGFLNIVQGEAVAVAGCGDRLSLWVGIAAVLGLIMVQVFADRPRVAEVSPWLEDQQIDAKMACGMVVLNIGAVAISFSRGQGLTGVRNLGSVIHLAVKPWWTSRSGNSSLVTMYDTLRFGCISAMSASRLKNLVRSAAASLKRAKKVTGRSLSWSSGLLVCLLWS
jgi:hypothetical protein